MSVRSVFQIVLAMVFAAASQAHAGNPWATRPDHEVYYRVSAESYGLGASNSDTILISLQPGADGKPFWAAERWQKKQQIRTPPLERHVWLDGRRCAALEKALRSLGELPGARIGGPTDYDQVGMVFDGGVVKVSGPGPGPAPGSEEFAAEGRRGRVVTLAEHFGPVVTWYFAAEPTLEHCWQDTPKLSDGAVLKSRINSDAEAAEQKP